MDNMELCRMRIELERYRRLGTPDEIEQSWDRALLCMNKLERYNNEVEKYTLKEAKEILELERMYNLGD